MNFRIMNLNLNGLLVTRQIDNTSPGGGAAGILVPGSRNRRNLDTQSSDISAREIRENLWKETTFCTLWKTFQPNLFDAETNRGHTLAR